MQNKKILITGGNSNIGSDLVKFFLKENLITLEKFWNKVLFMRENGFSKFDPKKIIDLSMLEFPKLNNEDINISESDEESVDME